MGLFDFLTGRKTPPPPSDLRTSHPAVAAMLERIRTSSTSTPSKGTTVSDDGSTGDGMAALRRASQLLEEQRYADAVAQALELFETLELKHKASALNIAGAAFFHLKRHARAVEHYGLAIMMGMPREDLQASLDEVRETIRVPSKVTDREMVRTALMGRLAEELVEDSEKAGEAEGISGVRLMRAQLFFELNIPQFAVPDLLRALELQPDKAMLQSRLLAAAAAMGDAEATEFLKAVPVTPLPASLRGKLLSLTGTFMDEVDEKFGPLLKKL